MKTEQFSIPVGWGFICGQTFGEKSEISQPIVLIHGYLDNSNSFKPIAPFLIQNSDYYLIAVDLPGMGHSSKLPDGIPYSLKYFVISISKVVKYFNLNKFVFLTHSLGCSIALAYSACFKEKVLALTFIDFALKECNIKLKDNIGEIWREDIDKFEEFECQLEQKKLNKVEKELSYDYALSRLLQSNKHIDELSAQILLERGLRVNEKNSLEYSRDIKLVTTVSMREYHLDFIQIYHSLVEDFNIPIQFIQADPPPYGDVLFEQINEMIQHLKEHSKNTVDVISMNGTHHFHMLKPAETADIVLKFLVKKCIRNESDEKGNDFIRM